MDKKDVRSVDFEVNTLYLLSLSMDLILRDSERRLRREGNEWRKEKKRAFNMFIDYVRRACTLIEQFIVQDIYGVEARNDYKYVQVWQEEANELARFILLISDRTSDVDVVNKIYDFIGL